ncbi:MAG: hypothetical protein ACJAS1_006703 [Oleiphilaceae bacterium]|jgi:hypothetical protein
MSELAIAFESWKLNPSKPGYLAYHGVKSRNEVETQIKPWKTGCSGKDNSTWV